MRGFLIAYHRFVKDDSGATMIEYALMVAFIATVCVVAVTALGAMLPGKFSSVTGSI